MSKHYIILMFWDSTIAIWKIETITKLFRWKCLVSYWPKYSQVLEGIYYAKIWKISISFIMSYKLKITQPTYQNIMVLQYGFLFLKPSK